MINRLLFFSTFILLLSSCNNYKNKKCDTCGNTSLNITTIKDRKLINFKQVKDFSIGFKGDKSTIYAEQFLKENKELILINYFGDDKLVYSDIEKETNIKDVGFPEGMISSFYRHNKDSIFILYRPEFRKDYNHDSTLLLTDETGKIFKFFNYDDANVISPRNKNKQKDSLMYQNQYFTPLVYEKNKIFLTFSQFGGSNYSLGGKDFLKTQLPNIGYVDLQKNKFKGLNKIKYPYLNDSTFYPGDYKIIHLTSVQNNKEVLISFEYTPLVYKYNYLTDSLIKIKGFKSIFRDSIYASSVEPKTNLKIQRYSYYDIFFDKIHNQYVRLFGFPYNKKLSSLIFSDCLFNVTAEGIVPKGYGFIASISKDTLLFINYTKSDKSSDSIYYSLFTIDENPGLTQKVYSEFQKDNSKLYDIKDYVKRTTKTNNKNYATIIIPADISCPGCVSETLRFFSDNIKKISEIPVYLIISSTKEKRTAEMLQKYNLENKLKTIFVDKSVNYFNYHPDNKGYNPRLILVENNKIKIDKIYNAKKIMKLQEDLIAFLIKHKFIKGST